MRGRWVRLMTLKLVVWCVLVLSSLAALISAIWLLV
jgi:hypothetical protein